MSFDSVTLPLHLTQSQLFLAPTVPLYTVPDLDKERGLAIPPVRPLPMPHLHDWRKMDVCLSISIKVKMMKVA